MVRDGYNITTLIHQRQVIDILSWLDSDERIGTYRMIPHQNYIKKADLDFPILVNIQFFNVSDALIFKLKWVGP